MKLAHLVVVTPNKAGLYETARDLVAAERRNGVDAFIVDPTRDGTGNDRGVPIRGWEHVADCDMMVSHSGTGERFKDAEKPVIHMLHGRPYSSFLLEQSGKIPVFSFLRQVADDDKYHAFVTFWPEFLPYWRLLLPDEKVHSIPSLVDLDLWTPDGPSGYSFHGHAGEVNVVCAEVWRDDIDPFHVLVAFARFAETVPGARLHIYAAPQKGTAWSVLKNALDERGILGEVVGFVKGLENVYRAADVAVTAQRIATRSVREPLACGCPVVMAPGNVHSEFIAHPENTEHYAAAIARAVGTADRKRVRASAEEQFDPQASAEAMLEIVEKVM